MTTRSAFLQTVRERLTDGIPHNPVRPLAPVDDDTVRYAVDLDDPVARFETAAGAVGAEVVRAADLASTITTVLDQTQARRVAVAAGERSDAVETVLRDRGLEIVSPDDVEALASADLGITGTKAGIALTGSLVVESSQRGTRLVSLLPDIHLALLEVETIAPTAGDVLRTFSRGPLASNVVLITGPSRSADIELQLTIGVHGPRRLIIGLMETGGARL